MANVYSSEVCLQTKKFPKISKFFFFKNTPKYDKLSKISNISIKTMLELQTKFGNFGNFGNFGHISDGLRKQYSVRTQCCNLIGSEPLYIPCIDSANERERHHFPSPRFLTHTTLRCNAYVRPGTRASFSLPGDSSRSICQTTFFLCFRKNT